MRRYHLIFPFLFFLYSCATVEQPPEQDIAEETEVVDEQRPEWYDYSNRSYADSLSFVGVGLASSVDSNTAQEQAMKQAEANLRYAIDIYAEEIRSELAERPGGGEFSSASFIINLRNTVQNLILEDDMETTSEHVEKSDSVHHIYIKVLISRQSAIRALDEALQNDAFSNALNEKEVL
ncbi:hypothetical protein BH23BAC3_BH23BAC3_16560 [soil metagenome]